MVETCEDLTCRRYPGAVSGHGRRACEGIYKRLKYTRCESRRPACADHRSGHRRGVADGMGTLYLCIVYTICALLRLLSEKGARTTRTLRHDAPPLIRLSPRPDRLRPHPAPRQLAGRGEDRRAVRAQLRGGWRKLRAAWRRGVRAVPLRDHWCPRLPRSPPEHGVDLRVRFPGRGVAHPARVRAPRSAAHRVWRGHGPGAPPGGGPCLQGAGPRGRLPWLSLDPLPGGAGRRRA